MQRFNNLEAYLDEVVETQGKLFDFISHNYPDKDSRDFIITYMSSKTRRHIDQSQAYLCTMAPKDLWEYFQQTESYKLKKGESIKGFAAIWIGEFYAYYQWYYNMPSSIVIQKVPLDYLLKAYHGLQDLDMRLAVEKVGRVD